MDEALHLPIDWRVFWCRWRDHEPKSLTASHTQTVYDALSARLASGARLIEKGVPYIVPYDIAVLERNAMKANERRLASLYVDWQGDSMTVADPTSISAEEASDAIKAAERQAEGARHQWDLVISSPADFEAVLESRRTGRSLVIVMQERGLLPLE